MTDFVRFEEYNDHEGEHWSWWLQVDGNEAELLKFEALLDALKDAVEFDLDYTLYPEEVEPEAVVDKLVEYADRNYYPAHNKVTGVLQCPNNLGEDAYYLYKGGITNYFKEPTSD
jgi:hypothetical protein